MKEELNMKSQFNDFSRFQGTEADLGRGLLVPVGMAAAG